MGFSKVAVALGLLLLAVVNNRRALVEASINCNQLRLKLTDCSEFIKLGIGPRPSCCRGVKDVNNLAKSRADRTAACQCLKGIISSVRIKRRINYDIVASLPGKCGVRLPYTISPSLDCNKA